MIQNQRENIKMRIVGEAAAQDPELDLKWFGTRQEVELP
jgi:hypothetical protein